jgi:hypothetical protein
MVRRMYHRGARVRASQYPAHPQLTLVIRLSPLSGQDSMNTSRNSAVVGLFVACLAVYACSSSSGSPDGGEPIDAGGTVAFDPSGSAAPANVPPPGPQTPPTDGADVRAWLDAGYYKSWHCEPAPHASRSPSPHNMNRICSNDLTSSFDGGAGERPEGSAGVKELYDATGTNIRGYAVYLKGAMTSNGGANWYWYESDPTVPASIRDSKDVLADGWGGSGAGPKALCVACHMAAGSDAAHTPSPGGSDEVYTQVH